MNKKTLTKLAPQFLLNFSGFKHARRLGHDSFERGDPELRPEYLSVRYQGAEIWAKQYEISDFKNLK